MALEDRSFEPASLAPGVLRPAGAAPIEGATGYQADRVGPALHYRFQPGALAGYRWLTAETLVDGLDAVVFELRLQEGADGPTFILRYSVLNQAQARIRLNFDDLVLRRWQVGRQGAWLKPMCLGEIVDLGRVDRMTLYVHGLGTEPARFCLTELTATVHTPPPLGHPLLPAGTLCDALGQSRLRHWPGKTASAEDVTARLGKQRQQAAEDGWPAGFSRWGGWREKRFEPTGFFRVQRDNQRWWLVDPDGCAYWSMGLDCVRPTIESYVTGLEEAYEYLPTGDDPATAFTSARKTLTGPTRFANFLGINLFRAFGADWHAQWSAIIFNWMKTAGFNGAGNWSDCPAASAARMPYVRPLGQAAWADVPRVFRDFVDVFDPSFGPACEAFAAQLEETCDDPALIGYFLMNEPNWGFTEMTPAEGMLRNYPAGPARAALAARLTEKYGDDGRFAQAWGGGVKLTDLAAGLWTRPITSEAAEADLAEFSSVMVEMLFGGLSAACRAVDPNHMNLGARYYKVPPEWAIAGMKTFDVFSINCYKDHFPAELIDELHAAVGVPVLIGEWHFGALDVGLPGAALRRVPDQAARGEAYRVFAEAALACGNCVGAHYFTLYEERASGRFDGENWNIGLMDVCHRPYEPLVAATAETGRRMYALACGQVEPYQADVNYLPTNVT